MIKPQFIGFGSPTSNDTWSSFYVEIENDVLVIFECNLDTYKFFAGTAKGDELLSKYNKFIIFTSSMTEASISGIPMFIDRFDKRPRTSIESYQDDQKMMKIMCQNADRMNQYIYMFNKNNDGTVKTYEPERLFYEIIQTFSINEIEYIPEFSGVCVYKSKDEKLDIDIEYIILPGPSLIGNDDIINMEYSSYIILYNEGENTKESLYYNGVNGFSIETSNKINLDLRNFTKSIISVRGIERTNPADVVSSLQRYRSEDKITDIVLTGFNSAAEKRKYDEDLNVLLQIKGAE